MRKIIHAMLLGAAVMTANAVFAAQPSYIGKPVSRPEDTRAIEKVIADFQLAIKTKDVKLLSSLMVSENPLWASPPPPEQMRELRQKLGPDFNGIRANAFSGFCRFIAESKVPLEERFYNVRITQDENVAWVMFDYEFVEDNRPNNYGVETWQMMKSADGAWKIASVFWSVHLLN
ncbi:MAG: YybH family protein [Ramlibacter sp.]